MDRDEGSRGTGNGEGARGNGDDEESGEPQRTADSEERLSAEEAFSLVANETRMEILLTLWEADEPLSFSELREAVGTRDSGQFNYHLDKLVGRFVRKTDEGYSLRYAGTQVVGSVYSGVYTRAASVGPVPVDGECVECGGKLVAAYEDEHATIDCEDCETTLTKFGVPPGIIEGRDPSDLPRTFEEWIRSQLEVVTRGFCPLCTGKIRGSVGVDDEDWADVGLLGVAFECERCGYSMTTVLGTALLSHPEVVAFHRDNGIDLSTASLWDLEWPYEDHVEVHETDPLRMDVWVELGDQRLVLDVRKEDGLFRVQSAERTRS